MTTFSVRVSIDNPNGEIKANMTANAEILIEEHKNVLTVPEQAVSYDAKKNAFVSVPDKKAKDGTSKVPVTGWAGQWHEHGDFVRTQRRGQGRPGAMVLLTAWAGALRAKGLQIFVQGQVLSSTP